MLPLSLRLVMVKEMSKAVNLATSVGDVQRMIGIPGFKQNGDVFFCVTYGQCGVVEVPD